MIDFRDFILFLKNPGLGRQFEINSIFSFLKLVWKSFFILLTIAFITGLGLSIPLKYFNLWPPPEDINFSLFNIFKIALFLPIVEELIFRLPLRISKVNLAATLSIILFLILYKFNIYLSLSLSIVLFGFLHLRIKNDSSGLKRIDRFFIKYFFYLFYSQAFVFGFFHLTNYKLDFKYFYLFPLFVANQIFMGCFFGYLRVRYKYGIYVCIVTHIVVNSIYCLVLSQ